MGQVIHLNPPSAAFPTAATALDRAETVFLHALRTWAAAYRSGENPLSRLSEAMDHAGVHDAAFSIDQLMAVIARTVRQPIAIHCPRCPRLSDAEMHLLHAAGLVQTGESSLAERVLRTTLLSAAGAEFALGPVEGLAELFAEAKLFFRKRPITRAALPDSAVRSPEPETAGPLN
jgi:hypothetical protein